MSGVQDWVYRHFWMWTRRHATFQRIVIQLRKNIEWNSIGVDSDYVIFSPRVIESRSETSSRLSATSTQYPSTIVPIAVASFVPLFSFSLRHFWSRDSTSPRPSRYSIHIPIDNPVIVDYKVMPYRWPQEFSRQSYHTDCWLNLRSRSRRSCQVEHWGQEWLKCVRCRLHHTSTSPTILCPYAPRLMPYYAHIQLHCFLTKRPPLVQAVHPRHLTRQWSQ